MPTMFWLVDTSNYVPAEFQHHCLYLNWRWNIMRSRLVVSDALQLGFVFISTD